MAKRPDIPITQQDDFFDVLSREFKLINESWEALVLNLRTFIFVYLLPVLALTVGALLLLPVFIHMHNGGDLNAIDVIAGVIAGLGLGFIAIIMAIMSLITQLASVRGEKITFQEALAKAQPFFWRFVGLALISGLLIIVGFILLIVPGFLAIFFLTLSTYVLIDKNTDISGAIRGSYDLVKSNWKLVLALLIVQGVIEMPSVLPVLGTFITFCLSAAYFCLPAIVYTRITKSNHNTKSKKKIA